MLRVLLACITVGVAIAGAFVTKANLPSYFDRCHMSNPHLSECIIKNGNKAIPRLVKGDIHYDIPNMQPLKLDKIVIRNDHEIHFILKNVEVRGLENARLKDFYLSFIENRCEQNLTIPILNIRGDYEMIGRIINIQVNGNGKANITIVNGSYTTGFEFLFDPDFYVTLINSYGSYRPQRVIYQFENLQSSNDFLGYQTNIYLNNNWREVSRNFQPEVSRIFTNFVTTIYQNIGYVSSLNETLPP